jgi:hypothetical protein
MIKQKTLFFLIISILFLNLVYAQDLTTKINNIDIKYNPDNFEVTKEDVTYWGTKKHSHTTFKFIKSSNIEIDGKIYSNLLPTGEGEGYITLDEKGKIVGTKFKVGETSSYQIGGYDIPLPKNSELYLYNHKQIPGIKSGSGTEEDEPWLIADIKIPQGTTIKEFPEKKQEGRPISFKYYSAKDETLSLEYQGNKIEIKPDSLHENPTFHFNQEYEDNRPFLVWGEIKLNDFQIGKLEPKQSLYLFFDGKEHETDIPYISINNNQMIVSSIKSGGYEEDSPDIIYKKDNAKTIIQALDGGQLKITTTENRLDITTNGGYKIFNGKLVEKNGKIGKLSESSYDLIQPTEKTIPLHIVSIKEDDTPMLGETFYDDNGNYFIGYKEADGIYKKANGDIYVEHNQVKTSFQNLNQEQKTKFSDLSKSEKLQILRNTANGGSLAETLNKINIINVPNLETHSSQKYSNIVNSFERKGDVAYEVHEGVHFYVNAPLSTGDWSPSTGGQRAFWLGEGEYTLVDKTGLIKGKIIRMQSRTDPSESDIFPGTGMTNYIPLEMVDESTTSNYFSSRFSNRDVIHTNEDSSTFQAETRALFNRQIISEDIGSLDAVIEFMIYDGSEGVYVLDKKPDYFETSKGGQLQALIKTQTENSMKLFNEAKMNPRLSSNYITQNSHMDKWGPTVGTNDKLILLRTSTSTKATNLRKFYIDNYGSDWTQKTLGFKYSEGSKN